MSTKRSGGGSKEQPRKGRKPIGESPDPKKIVSIESLRSRHARRARCSDQVSPKTRSPEEESRPPAPEPSPLTPEERDGLIKELQEELDGLPDVRIDKVIDAKLRISTGYYDRQDIRMEILESILGMKTPDDERTEGGDSPPPPQGP